MTVVTVYIQYAAPRHPSPTLLGYDQGEKFTETSFQRLVGSVFNVENETWFHFQRYTGSSCIGVKILICVAHVFFSTWVNFQRREFKKKK